MDDTPLQIAGCPECGALVVDGLTCWDMLGLLIAWESQDPALQAEHFLIVASYNLQHPAQFTDEALMGLRQAYVERLDHNRPVAEIRRQVGRAMGGATRVLKPESERQPVLRQWNMTIADVYLAGQPEGAVERVRAWAGVIKRTL